MSNQKILEIKDLKKHFPIKRGFWQKPNQFVKAVDGVDLAIKSGETLSKNAKLSLRATKPEQKRLEHYQLNCILNCYWILAQ